MNRLINQYGSIDHTSSTGKAVAELELNIGRLVRDFITAHNLTPEEIIILDSKLQLAVSADCCEALIRKGIAIRKQEREEKPTIKLPETMLPQVMVMGKRLTPTVWCNLFGVEVVDADGWGVGTWFNPITLDQFISKYNASTCRIVDKEKYLQWKHLFSRP